MEYVGLILTAVFVNNFVLTQFLGLCPFFGVSNKPLNSWYMGIATTTVLMISSILSYTTYHFVLLNFGLGYLHSIFFIVIVAFSVLVLEILLRNLNPILYQLFGIYLPLITSNCAVLGVMLININQDHTFIQSIFYAFGAGLGFTLVLLVFASLRDRLTHNQVPKYFKGTPIAFVTASILSMIFIGLF